MVTINLNIAVVAVAAVAAGAGVLAAKAAAPHRRGLRNSADGASDSTSVRGDGLSRHCETPRGIKTEVCT